jgi:hypothetical protein
MPAQRCPPPPHSVWADAVGGRCCWRPTSLPRWRGPSTRTRPTRTAASWTSSRTRARNPTSSEGAPRVCSSTAAQRGSVPCSRAARVQQGGLSSTSHSTCAAGRPEQQVTQHVCSRARVQLCPKPCRPPRPLRPRQIAQPLVPSALVSAPRQPPVVCRGPCLPAQQQAAGVGLCCPCSLPRRGPFAALALQSCRGAAGLDHTRTRSVVSATSTGRPAAAKGHRAGRLAGRSSCRPAGGSPPPTARCGLTPRQRRRGWRGVEEGRVCTASQRPRLQLP